MRYESDNYLAHHGIKGQQWGVRRFQNEDGTLTEAGKDRYLVGKERAEEYRQNKKEEIAKLEKSNPFVNRANKEMAELKRNYDLDDNGRATWKTNLFKYSEDQVRQAEDQYRALQKMTKNDREVIKQKAGERAIQRLIDKYGETSIKDMEYYHSENTRRNSRIGKIMIGLFAALAATPLVALLVKKPIENYKREQAAKNYRQERDMLIEAYRQHDLN